jgi:predicted porin
MKMNRILLLAMIFFSFCAQAQNTTLLDSINFYGSLRAHVAVYDQIVEMENNGSRIGINMFRRNIIGFDVEGRLELGVNLLKNNTSFNPGAASADNPSSFLTEQIAAVTTRLGFIGIHSAKWGSLLIGKQWSVYYDVSNFTDNFSVFGGSASGTYNTGSDGGGEGTGRAESAITYRNVFKNLTLGLQAQFPGGTFNYAGSLVYHLPHGFTVGAAYNYYDIPKDIQQVIVNTRKDANSFVTSLKYSNSKTDIAVTYAYNQSEAQFPTDSTIVGFSANGIELYAHYFITDKFMILGGINYLKPAGTFNSVPPNFKVLYFPVGATYTILPGMHCYAEFQLNQGININGNNQTNVFTIGFRYDFNFAGGNTKAGSKDSLMGKESYYY